MQNSIKRVYKFILVFRYLEKECKGEIQYKLRRSYLLKYYGRIRFKRVYGDIRNEKAYK